MNETIQETRINYCQHLAHIFFYNQTVLVKKKNVFSSSVITQIDFKFPTFPLLIRYLF